MKSYKNPFTMQPVVKTSAIKKVLEELYAKYNRREYVHPDPLEFLYNYKNLQDREIVGFIASSLAYGRVGQILKSVSLVLGQMGSSPYDYLIQSSASNIKKGFCNFKHRFTTGDDISRLLMGIKETVKEYGSLNSCFASALSEDHDTILPALDTFVQRLSKNAGRNGLTLLPSPEKGSACKRLNLFLRWMVRTDDVDPGGWTGVHAAKLIVPLDTHMYKIGLSLGLTQRKQANLRTAMEITSGFRNLSPTDPVKYDFALTRLGIRNDASIDSFLKSCSTS